jgi:hypothetical protein
MDRDTRTYIGLCLLMVGAVAFALWIVLAW